MDNKEIRKLSDAELDKAEEAAHTAMRNAQKVYDTLLIAWSPFYEEKRHRAIRAEIRKEMEKENGPTN